MSEDLGGTPRWANYVMGIFIVIGIFVIIFIFVAHFDPTGHFEKWDYDNTPKSNLYLDYEFLNNSSVEFVGCIDEIGFVIRKNNASYLLIGDGSVLVIEKISTLKDVSTPVKHETEKRITFVNRNRYGTMSITPTKDEKITPEIAMFKREQLILKGWVDGEGYLFEDKNGEVFMFTVACDIIKPGGV